VNRPGTARAVAANRSSPALLRRRLRSAARRLDASSAIELPAIDLLAIEQT
jgi:hypothetical protein